MSVITNVYLNKKKKRSSESVVKLKALLDRDAFASRSPTQNQLVRCIRVATF